MAEVGGDELDADAAVIFIQGSGSRVGTAGGRKVETCGEPNNFAGSKSPAEEDSKTTGC